MVSSMRLAVLLAVFITAAATTAPAVLSKNTTTAVPAVTAGNKQATTAAASKPQAGTKSPCIECKECKTNNCFGVCKRSCGMDVEKCKKVGKDVGGKIGKDACATTKKYCGGNKKGGHKGKTAKVTLKQCQNIAYGMCQRYAKEEAMKPRNGCKAAFMRFRRCNKDEWAGFWYPEVNELCAKAVKARINY